MQSLLLMTVLSGAAHAPEQYYPCGYTRVFHGPAVAYVAAGEPVYAADSGSGSTKRKLDDLAAQLQRISERIDAAENRFAAMEAKQKEMVAKHKEMEAKHKEMAANLRHKLEEHARHMEKMVEARIKEERVRQELAALREKTQAMETAAKALNMIRVESMHQHLAKLENQIKKLEIALANNQQPTKGVGVRGSDSNSTFEASEDISAGEVPDGRALIVVMVPENARLYVNGQLKKGNSSQRFILTPQLEDGDYYYTLRIDVDRDGRTQSQTRQISFRRGMQVRVSLDNPRP
jgi:uncharacterized protein (TIGR03000 family)